MPDGRAKTVRANSRRASSARRAPHRPLPAPRADPRTPWRTSVRRSPALLDDGLVRRVSLANVNRLKLDEAVAVALSHPFRWR